MSNATAVQFVENAKAPIRFEKLRPGSYFKVVSEPSRGVHRPKDERMYLKSSTGFFSICLANGAGAVLMPNDVVMPMRKVRYATR